MAPAFTYEKRLDKDSRKGVKRELYGKENVRNSQPQKSQVKRQKPNWKKGIWDQTEDELLLEKVREQEPGKKKINWTLVSAGVKTRSCKQCRERWVNHLNPDVVKTKWLEHEDKALLELGKLFPKKWAKISRRIPGRTENMVKIRWNSLTRHHKQQKRAVVTQKICPESANESVMTVEKPDQFNTATLESFGAVVHPLPKVITSETLSEKQEVFIKEEEQLKITSETLSEKQEVNHGTEQWNTVLEFIEGFEAQPLPYSQPDFPKQDTWGVPQFNKSGAVSSYADSFFNDMQIADPCLDVDIETFLCVF